MKILVTGGAGFIGSAVAKRLLDERNEVVIVDNLNPYYDPALKRARLESLTQGASFYEADIADKQKLEEIFKKYPFDVIYHLAAQAGVRYSLSHPEVYQRTNVDGTKNILELAHAHGNPRIIFASSSSVYGDTREVPFTEKAGVGNALSPYARTKQEGEKLCKEYAEKYGMNITALRFFTVYGPWGRPDMALFSFTEKILNNEPIEIYNNGDMKRDFTYIDDIVEGLILALKNQPPGFEVFNLGRGAPVPLMDFVRVLEEKLGKSAQKINKPMQEGDMKETYASISKAQKGKEQGGLDFHPKVQIVKGVGEFVDWYRSYTRK